MELKNNKIGDIYGDFDFERKAKIPQCYNCIYSEGEKCKKYNAVKSELSEKGIDIFNCPSYESNETENIKKIKGMGFSESGK